MDVVEAWHGTVRQFRAFDPNRSETEFGCFFSDTPEASVAYADREGGRIVRVRLHMTNPYRCTAYDWYQGTCLDPKEVSRVGVHDGYVVDGLDGTTFIAWNPETIEMVGDDYLFGTQEFRSLRRSAFEAGYLDVDDVDPDLADTVRNKPSP